MRRRPGPRARSRTNFAPGAAPAFAIALAVAAALAAALFGCGAAGSAAKRPETAQFIDEAFAALFPEAWERLGKLPEAAPQRLGPSPKGAAVSPAAPLALQSIGLAADRLLARLPREGAAADGKETATAAAIVASPLAAERLIAAAAATGARLPPLVVPFASSFGLAGEAVREVRYGYAAAYAAMGRRAAAAVKKLAAKGAERSACGIVFQENFMRGGDALAAFSSAFSAACGQNPVVVTLDAGAAVDQTGAAKAAVAELLGGTGAPAAAPPPAVGVLVLAIDNASVADEAALAAKGAEVLADASSWGDHSPDARLYRAAVKGDEAGLARAAAGLARRLASGRGAPASTAVPLRFGAIFPRIF